MAQRRRKSTPLPLPSEAFAFDADDSLFSSSQQINELDARPRDAGAAPGCDDWAGDRPPGARLQGTKRSASTAQLGNAGAASSTRRRRTSLPALGAFQTLESSCSNSRPGCSSCGNQPALPLLAQVLSDVFHGLSVEVYYQSHLGWLNLWSSESVNRIIVVMED
eukprot:1160396-Pelagomonas_calceolata.AAC.11